MDKQTLDDVQRGDQQAFARVVTHFQQPLFAYLGRMGLQQAVAEELIQEVFIRAWQARKQFDCTQASYATWLFTIARRRTLNELDRAARRYELAEGNTLHHRADQAATPFEQVQKHAQQERLARALRQLSTHDRSLLALAYYHDLTIDDIARIEAIPAGTIKSRLHRIRKQLKTDLECTR